MAAATPYALGRFRAHTDFGPRADDFTGVIIESEAAPLAALLPAAPDLDALLADWPATSPGWPRCDPGRSSRAVPTTRRTWCS
jgi:hypothetical protein